MAHIWMYIANYILNSEATTTLIENIIDQNHL